MDWSDRLAAASPLLLLVLFILWGIISDRGDRPKPKVEPEVLPTPPASVETRLVIPTVMTPVDPYPPGATPIDMINIERQRRGLKPLTEHPALMLSAQSKANDMSNRDYYGHESPEGERPFQLAQRSGYPSAYVGENIAKGYKTHTLAIVGWMNSEGHRENILRPEFEHLGYGEASKWDGTKYYVHQFGFLR